MKLTRLPVCFLSLFTTVTMLIGVKIFLDHFSFFLFKKQNQNQKKKHYPEGGHCYRTEGMT